MSEINMIRGVKSSFFVEQMVLVPVDEANFYVALLLFNIACQARGLILNAFVSAYLLTSTTNYWGGGKA